MLQFLVFVGRRLGLLVAVFLLASAALFAAVRAVPGDPVALRLKTPDPALVAQERERLGLDRPLVEQWGMSMRQFVAGDWGRSLLTSRRVREDFGEYFPATLELGMAGLVLGIFIGVLTAVLAEVLHLEAWRRVSFFFGTIGLTVPIFWIGLLMLLGGSLGLGWFPPGGRFDLSLIPPPARTGWLTVDALLAGDMRAFVVALHHLALPALCVSLYPAAQVCSVLQGRLQDRRLVTLMTSLRARGFGPWRIWGRHLSRVVSAPVITVVGSNFGMLLGGAVLTETVFSWPGLGRYLVGAVLDRDLYVVQHVLLAVIMLVVCVVLLTDFLALVVNPVASREARAR